MSPIMPVLGKDPDKVTLTLSGCSETVRQYDLELDGHLQGYGLGDYKLSLPKVREQANEVPLQWALTNEMLFTAFSVPADSQDHFTLPDYSEGGYGNTLLKRCMDARNRLDLKVGESITF